MYKIIKRMFDICASGIALIVLSPLWGGSDYRNFNLRSWTDFVYGKSGGKKQQAFQDV